MMEERMAACPHCGQMIAVVGDGMMAPEEQREAAGRKCMCDGAKRARMIRESLDRIEQVCGETSTNNGFEHALPDSTMTELHRLVEAIVDGRVRKAVLQIAGGNSVQLSDGIGAVKVKRTCKRQLEM